MFPALSLKFYSYLQALSNDIAARGSMSLHDDILKIQINEELVVLGCSIIWFQTFVR